ncbi:GNAT family N-acetyltransferase [Pseudoteredinibacter isoporae]|uniref:GNAT family N-acetyltransferase n=1 Tax=Pseudoteredinibacter isoporae TaxID=570281 RepID=UPI00310AD318
MIKEIERRDFDAFWPSFSAIVGARDSYAFEPNMSYEQAYELWCLRPLKTYVYIEDGQVLGSYYIKANGMGPGAHVCNCGYMVSEAARGKGLARKLCEHSQQVAVELGFKAMQFNSVVATNEVAVKLWQTLGFDIVGTLPKAYQHGRLGYVDCHVMYKLLQGI